MNKLKKEIHKYEGGKAKQNGNVEQKKRGHSISDNNIQELKNEIINNIKKLNLEQKKGIVKIIPNKLFDKYQDNNIIQFDISKIPVYQLNQLNKYINDCINSNNIISRMNKSIDDSIEDKKENESCKYDLVSFVSDDDYYDGDLD